MEKIIISFRFLSYLTILALPLAAAAQTNDFPLYTQWMSFNVGSSVTDSNDDGTTMRTTTLDAKTNDAVTLGLVVNGTAMDETTIPRACPPKIKIEDRGIEPLQIAGKTYLCHHYTMQYSIRHNVNGDFIDDGKVIATDDDWFCPDIPGAAKYSGKFPDDTDPGTINTNSEVAVSWVKK
jgi:hypothetical protein